MVVHPVDRCDGPKEVGDTLGGSEEINVVVVDTLGADLVGGGGVAEVDLDVCVVGGECDASDCGAVDIVADVGGVVFLLSGENESPSGEDTDGFQRGFCGKPALVGGAEADGIAYGDECAEEIKGL